MLSKNKGLAELKRIIEECRGRQFKKNQVIYYEGNKGNGLYLVIKGRIKTVKMAEDGRELMTGIYTADEYLEIHSPLSDETYSETATALEDIKRRPRRYGRYGDRNCKPNPIRF